MFSFYALWRICMTSFNPQSPQEGIVVTILWRRKLRVAGLGCCPGLHRAGSERTGAKEDPLDSGVLGSPLSWAHRGPRLHQQVPGAHLEPSSTGQGNAERTGTSLPRQGPLLSREAQLWLVPCLSFKNDHCFFFFYKGLSICQGEGETLPMETGQRLSSRGYPGFSFGKCVFAKVGGCRGQGV